MKKIYLAVFLACSIGGAVKAQESGGGLPWSMSITSDEIADQTIKSIALKSPDYEAALKQDEADAKAGVAKPYNVGLLVPADISLSNSGTFSYLADGRRIWRATVNIDRAEALNFYYDKFNLPKGVKYYITNSNGKQILGSFTSKNNAADGLFATSIVQGNIVNLELDIDKEVDVKTIVFHINEVGAFYRGQQALTAAFGSSDEGTGMKPTDGSSPCQVNAICPQGAAYPKPRKATVHILIRSEAGAPLGYCSGTVINNTGNGGSTCKPYLLTATHCDADNSRTDAHFAQWIFTFNNELPTCTATGNGPTNQTIIGANFRARSNYTSFPPTSPTSSPLVADFLLLELKTAIPVAYGAYLAGWNRRTDLGIDPDADFFIGFHHPAGDVKKLSTSLAVDAGGTFNQSTIPATHWTTSFNVGGTEGGSSGSGLFDKAGLLIGDLSGGPSSTGACAPMGTIAEYSKLSYGWENSFDQTAFPAFAGAASRLKDWLDPTNSGAITLAPALADCSDIVGIEEVQILDNSISIYPNPVTNGQLTVKVNLPRQMDIRIRVYNVLGSIVKEYSLDKAYTGKYTTDLSSLPAGNYIVKFHSENETIGKKITILK